MPAMLQSLVGQPMAATLYICVCVYTCGCVQLDIRVISIHTNVYV